MTYKDLNLSFKQEYYQTVMPDGKKVNVKTYLPIQDKKDLVQITLQKSEERDGFYNEILVDIYFHLFLVFLYTDIEFSEKDRENLFLLYDELMTSGYLDCIINAIDDSEYNGLLEYLKAMKRNDLDYKRSVAALVQKMVVDLPKNMEAAAKIVEDFDPEKYKEVIEFAKNANGGRPIS